MLPRLFIVLLLIPLVELYLLIQVGSAIGPLATIALCVATAALGSVLLRWQGLSTLMRLRESLDRGDLPALEIAEGAALLVAGLLLLTPGIATDVLGFVALIPPLRRELLLRFLQRHLRPAGPPGAGQTVDGEARPATSRVRRIEVVDGEFRPVRPSGDDSRQ